MTLKDQIEIALKKRGKVVKDLLPLIDMTETGYYAMFRNDSMKVRTLQKISAVLKVPVSEFLNESSGMVVNEPGTEYKVRKKLIFDLEEIKELRISLSDKRIEISKK